MPAGFTQIRKEGLVVAKGFGKEKRVWMDPRYSYLLEDCNDSEQLRAAGESLIPRDVLERFAVLDATGQIQFPEENYRFPIWACSQIRCAVVFILDYHHEHPLLGILARVPNKFKAAALFRLAKILAVSACSVDLEAI